MLPALQLSNNGVSFHVVAPSLPNFGWSEGVQLKGFGLKDYATTCHRLMQKLGYEKYVFAFIDNRCKCYWKHRDLLLDLMERHHVGVLRTAR